MKVLLVSIDQTVVMLELSDIDSMETIAGGLLVPIAWLDGSTLLVGGKSTEDKNPLASRILFAATQTRKQLLGNHLIVGASAEDFFDVPYRWARRLVGHIRSAYEEKSAI